MTANSPGAGGATLAWSDMALEVKGRLQPSEAELARQTQDAEDRRLVARAAAGDRLAFAALVERHHRGVFQFCYRMMGQREEAEDVAQEVFLQVHRYLARWRGDSRFTTWLYRVAASQCVDALRRRPPQPSVELDERLQSDRLGPEGEFWKSETALQTRRALAKLPEIYRLVVVMFYFEELPVSEIARALDLSENTVKARLHRAREKLAVSLGPTVLNL